MKRPSRRPLAAALALVASCLAAGGAKQAQAQPSLSHIVPGAIAPGSTTQVRLHGAKLDGPVRVWTSFPAQIQVAPGAAGQNDQSTLTCTLTLGRGVQPGIGGIVVATPHGASDVLYVLIDDLPSAADSGQNHAVESPQDISLPVAVDGQCDGTLFDYYRFAAKAGQPIACEVVATRLGWDFDPLVRVLDARGNELQLADDDPSAGPDPRFVFVPPADGQYTLELRDNRYKPGGRYRLRLGDFPLVSTPLPLAAQRGAATKLLFSGLHLPALEPLQVLLPLTHEVPRQVPIGVKAEANQAAGWATLLATDLPVFPESNSAGPSREPAAINLPCVAAGVLESGGDRDLFQFEGTKGTRVTFRATARSVGSPAILSLRLFDKAGKPLAESPVNDNDEPIWSLTLPADGAFRLAVEDLAGRGGSDYAYAVECRSGPQFSLSLKSDKNNRLKYAVPGGGGALYLDVQCQRLGYDGPISLNLHSSRPGWSAYNNVIAARTNEIRMYLVAPLDFEAGELAELRITGRALASDLELEAPLTTTTQLRAAYPPLACPPAWHDGTIFVSGLPPKPYLFALKTPSDEVNVPPGGEGKLQLEVERIESRFKDPLTILPVGVPSKVAAEVKRSTSGSKECYEIVFSAANDVVPGRHLLRFVGYGELSGEGRAVLSGDVRLNILSP